jgi:TonB-dependent starch-binding outer membrane protein SusC
MKKQMQKLILLIFLVSPAYTFSQSRKISGTLVAFEKFPLTNVRIMAKKAKKTAISDDKGYFEIEVLKNDLLRIRETAFVEYNKKITDDVNSIQINLIIRNDQKSIEKAVEGGYITRENLEYGMKNLLHFNNEFSQFSDAYEAIKYALPESTIIIENGKKGIQLRGPKTMSGSNMALLIVDGVIVDDVNFINPGDILGISKLSSSASALYGARAMNGVINIKTR